MPKGPLGRLLVHTLDERPESFIADRYLDKTWNTVLYKIVGGNYKILSIWPKIFAHGPREGIDVEDWFAEISTGEKEASIRDEVSDATDFREPTGEVDDHLLSCLLLDATMPQDMLDSPAMVTHEKASEKLLPYPIRFMNGTTPEEEAIDAPKVA